DKKKFLTPLTFKSYNQWSYWQRKAFDYLIWCHLAHALDFSAALSCWLWIFPITFPEVNEWHFKWVSQVFLYNIACECIVYSFWHWMTYARINPYPKGPLHEKKRDGKKFVDAVSVDSGLSDERCVSAIIDFGGV
ncbi:unnamed protein product, partial [Rotaria sp. Silwood1]